MPGPSALDDYARRRELRVVGGTEAMQPPPPPGDGSPGDPASDCPVTVLGHDDGTFYFLDMFGQLRKLTSRQIGSRADLMSLFFGDAAWLLRHFPRTATRKFAQNGQQVEEEVVIGVQTSAAGDCLMAMAGRAGVFGAHVVLRGAGIWSDTAGAPVAHCGDAVMVEGRWHRAGGRVGDTVWTLAAASPRPEGIADAEVARGLAEDIRTLWDFRLPGGDMLVLGLVGTAYYGAAAPWRPNGFLTGSASSGKTMLLNLLRALTPLHHYTNDTSKAGVEQACSGHAMPIFIDETSDRADQRGAEALMDLMLTSTGGEGTKGHRGSQGGQVRVIELIGAVIMASVNAPAMQPQHLSRIAMIELRKAQAGSDNRASMEAAIGRARASGPALWGRALAGWPRWRRAFDGFRVALGKRGCAPREMDQYGALLAGWWVLVEDGVPDAPSASSAVEGIATYLPLAGAVALEDAPRRVLQHLMTIPVQRDRSTDVEPIGSLIESAFKFSDTMGGKREDAVDILGRNCIRVVYAVERFPSAPPVPRGGDGDGIWIAIGNAAPLAAIFRSTEFAGSRWKQELLRIESARRFGRNIRIKAYTGDAVWLPLSEVLAPIEDAAEPLGP